MINGFPLRIDSNRKILDNVASIAWNDLPLDTLDTWRDQLKADLIVVLVELLETAAEAQEVLEDHKVEEGELEDIELHFLEEQN